MERRSVVLIVAVAFVAVAVVALVLLVDVPVNEAGGLNVIGFPSGYGDGSYPTWFGLDADGEPLVLLTDFGILDAPGFTWTGAPTTKDDSPLGATASLLTDGRVLITEGCGTAAELYDPATGSFSGTGSLTATRGGNTATRLRDGRVLFTGGYNCARAGEDGIWASAEIYDPATGTFSATGSMKTPREFHTATLWKDGRVLVAGGISGSQPIATGGVILASVQTAETSSGVLATAEVYDPATGTFSKTGSMSAFRDNHTATLLQDGRVLVLGGRSPRDSVYRSAEVYDPGSGTFSPAGSMGEGRQQHTATLLPDGRVVIAGGFWSDGQRWRVLSSTESYDPGTGDFTSIGSMRTPRSGHTATILDDGRVLIAGGSDIGYQGSVGVDSAVLYQP